jgi:hypothetical protein
MLILFPYTVISVRPEMMVTTCTTLHESLNEQKLYVIGGCHDKDNKLLRKEEAYHSIWGCLLIVMNRNVEEQRQILASVFKKATNTKIFILRPDLP